MHYVGGGLCLLLVAIWALWLFGMIGSTHS